MEKYKILTAKEKRILYDKIWDIYSGSGYNLSQESVSKICDTSIWHVKNCIEFKIKEMSEKNKNDKRRYTGLRNEW